MASVTPEANPGTCYAHWHPMEKGCVQRGEGGEGWQGCFTSGEKKPADPLLPSPGSVLGEKWPGDRGWRPGHRRHAESAHLAGALGHLFHSGFQWCWAGNSFFSETQEGREFPTSMYLPWLEFQVQIHHLLIFQKQCIWQIQVSPLSSSALDEPSDRHPILLWEPVVPEITSSSWVDAPGENSLSLGGAKFLCLTKI